MNKKSFIKAWPDFKCRAAVLAAASLLVSEVNYAQEAREEEEVLVTGSRIARGSDFENPTPVVTVDRDFIEKTGYNNLQQLLEKLPINGNGAFSTRGNNQDSTANGAASISLRGLGADATLVLVNGRRVAISAFAEGITTNFVDINSIPVSAIKRIEVLKDGSSAVYGSDAVAGVVNVILRDDFQGFELAGNSGSADGYDENSASAIWGVGDDDYNVTLVMDYFRNSSLFNNERSDLATANQSARGGMDFRSSRGYPGRFVVDGETTIDPSCPADSIAGQTCLYDYGPWNVLIPESERVGALLLGHQKINDNIEGFLELAVQHNNSIAQGAPTPLDEDAALTVPIDHPNNPFTDAATLGLGRYRTVDAGARQWDIQTDNLRAVFGLRGTLLDNWSWEVAAQKARSESKQTGDRSQGWIRTDLLQAEIDAGRYNPFGGVQNSQEVIDAITTSLVRQGKSRLSTYEASISGSLLNLPAGELRMAAGLEYREEEVSDIPDDQFQRGLIFGTESVSAAASRDNSSIFIEFAIPLLEDLELNLAARHDDYSDFGTTTNPKIALRWSPIEELALRTSWGTGFRAPSLAQIGLGPSQESQFFVDTYGCDADVPGACVPLDYNLIFAGNPELDAEESESFNFGAIWKVTPDIELTADYWEIEQENKIDEVPFGYLYDEFCNDQDSSVCRRAAPVGANSLGVLQSINTGYINIGEQNTSGLDLSGYFGLGNLTLGFTYTHLLEFDRVELDASGEQFITRSLAGEYEYPEDRIQINGDWQGENWGAFASLNYIGSFEDTPDIDFDGELDYDQNNTPKVDTFTTLNVQLRYTGIEHTTLMFSIDNVFDEDPPFAAGDGDSDLYGYVQNLHSPLGRFMSVRAIFRF